MKRLLFTTKTCPNCPAAKDFLDLKGIDYESVDASVPEGLELAKKFGIGTVPTLITTDDNDKMTDSATGIDEIEAAVDED